MSENTEVAEALVLKLEPGDIMYVRFPADADQDMIQHALKAFASCIARVGLEGQVAVIASTDALEFSIVRAA